MKRKFRLRKQTDFERVRRFGKSYAHPLVVLVALSNKSDQTRIGISASKTVGGAVQRNRAKRRIRGVLQPLLARIAPGWDLVLIARRPICDATFQDLGQAIASLMRKLNLLADI